MAAEGRLREQLEAAQREIEVLKADVKVLQEEKKLAKEEIVKLTGRLTEAEEILVSRECTIEKIREKKEELDTFLEVLADSLNLLAEKEKEKRRARQVLN